MSITECSQESFCCYFNRTVIVFDFPLGPSPINLLCMILQQCHKGIQSHGEGLTFIQIVVGYSYKLCADVTLVCLANRSSLQIKEFIVWLMFPILFFFFQLHEYIPMPQERRLQVGTIQLLSFHWIVQMLSSAVGPYCQFMENRKHFVLSIAYVVWEFSWNPSDKQLDLM